MQLRRLISSFARSLSDDLCRRAAQFTVRAGEAFRSGENLSFLRESTTRLRDFLPLVEEVAEKQSMLELLAERTRRIDPVRIQARPSPLLDAAELWDFLEGAVESLDARDRLIAEFRRASRHLLRASHAVFFSARSRGISRRSRNFFFFAWTTRSLVFLKITRW